MEQGFYNIYKRWYNLWTFSPFCLLYIPPFNTSIVFLCSFVPLGVNMLDLPGENRTAHGEIVVKSTIFTWTRGGTKPISLDHFGPLMKIITERGAQPVQIFVPGVRRYPRYGRSGRSPYAAGFRRSAGYHPG